MQHLLQAAKWDTMAAMAAVRGFVCEHLDDEDGVSILDESGQEKKGSITVGVNRQYVGCAGRASNAINVVYCSFAVKAGHALVGARPYLPREWATDPDRRARARVPEEVTFATSRSEHSLARRRSAGQPPKARRRPRSPRGSPRFR
jgi:SRSO17 transposase